jgi:hypothetical protein
MTDNAFARSAEVLACVSRRPSAVPVEFVPVKRFVLILVEIWRHPESIKGNQSIITCIPMTNRGFVGCELRDRAMIDRERELRFFDTKVSVKNCPAHWSEHHLQILTEP